jgi:uncharacterized protein YoxC
MAEDLGKVVNDITNLVTAVNELKTAVAELKTDMSGHVHGGITAGSANSSAAPTISAAVTATAIVQQTS